MYSFDLRFQSDPVLSFFLFPTFLVREWVSRSSLSADMVAEQDNLVVGRDDLIADGEGDRSTFEAKDDAALLVRLPF